MPHSNFFFDKNNKLSRLLAVILDARINGVLNEYNSKSIILFILGQTNGIKIS